MAELIRAGFLGHCLGPNGTLSEPQPASLTFSAGGGVVVDCQLYRPPGTCDGSELCFLNNELTDVAPSVEIVCFVEPGEVKLNRKTGEAISPLLSAEQNPALLTVAETVLVADLMDNQGDIRTRLQLLRAHMPGAEQLRGRSPVDVHLSRARRKLGQTQHTPQIIETVPRRGYRVPFPMQNNS